MKSSSTNSHDPAVVKAIFSSDTCQPQNQLVIINTEKFIRKNCIVLKLYRKIDGFLSVMHEEKVLSENTSSQKAKVETTQKKTAW